MRAARKCDPIRGMHSTRFSTRGSKRPLRNPRKNSPELLVSFMSAVEAESVFVEVGLQVFVRNRVIDPADPALHQTPEPFNRIGVNVAHHVDTAFVANLTMAIVRWLPIFPEILDALIGGVLIGVNQAAGSDVLHDSSEQVGFIDRRDYPRHDFSPALCDADYRNLFLVSAHGAANSVLSLPP